MTTNGQLKWVIYSCPLSSMDIIYGGKKWDIMFCISFIRWNL